MQNVRFDPSRDVARRPRGRPRAFDRDAALERAMLLFWQKGYAATSISDLTEAMGIGSPSLYAAFGSKEQLYAEALRFYVERYGHRVWAGFTAAASVRAAIEAYLTDSAATLARGCDCREPAGCMVMLSAVGGEGRSQLGDLVDGMRAGVLSQLTERIERGIAEGELSNPLDAGALARFVLAVQGGMALQARDGASPSQIEAVARMAMRAWDSLTAP